ncbi:MAG TPA: hypothetical protein VFJ16_24845 [Longimicrobium sp.]|nr:hypothetical protein [Longimicrobium sp.]
MSWQAYVMGMRGLSLSNTRQLLRDADAVSAGMATEDSRRAWFAGL